jgi:hypothetical protein
MRRLLRENGLSLALLGFFVSCLVGQAIAGHHEYNGERREQGRPALTLGAYLTSPHFAEATFENWESEFLQMGFYVVLTVFLFQRGSAESKDVEGEDEVDEDPRRHRGDPDAPWAVRRGGLALRVYEHSLSLAFLLLFALSFALHAASSFQIYNEARESRGEPPVHMAEFLASSRLWFESFQNWQSEFLAVGSIVVLSIFLREKGSPESKPVAAPHGETGA